MIKVIYHEDYHDFNDEVYEFNTYQECYDFFEEKYDLSIIDSGTTPAIVKSSKDNLIPWKDTTNSVLLILNIDKLLNPNYSKMGTYSDIVKKYMRDYIIDDIID